jgi:hypothetical protein
VPLNHRAAMPLKTLSPFQDNTAMAVRYEIHHTFADLRTTMCWCHICFGLCFVEENELFNGDGLLKFFPFFTVFDNVIAMLFGGTKRLFSM